MPGTPLGCGSDAWVSPVQSASTVCPDATVPAVVSSSRHETTCSCANGTCSRSALAQCAPLWTVSATAVCPPTNRTTAANATTRAIMGTSCATLRRQTLGSAPAGAYACGHHNHLLECGGNGPHDLDGKYLTSIE